MSLPLAEQQPDENVPDTRTSETYQAPRIETVLTPDDMAREVLYAGNITNDFNNA